MKTQKKILFSMLAVAAVLSFSACGKKTANEPSGTPASKETPADNSAADTEASGKMTYKSIMELMEAGKPLTCAWQDKTDGGDMTGSIFVDGKRFRSDIVMAGKNDEGQDALEVEMHNISDGQFVYIWNSMPGSKAMKMDLEKLKKTDTAATEEEKSSVDLEQELDLNCDSWSVDETVFNLPSDIEFTDQTDMINAAIESAGNMQNEASAVSGLPGMSAEEQKKICDICQMSPAGEAREACLSNAKCE
jgi:predicted small lipoprotein YifL